MTRYSLKSRWLLVSAATITVVLTIIAIVAMYLFQQGLERRFQEELTGYVNQIANNLEFDDDGRILPPYDLSDQRFSVAQSGLYWQIDDPEMGAQLQSGSLGEFLIPLPVDTHDAGSVHQYNLPGPVGSVLVVQERSLTVAAPAATRAVRIAVALNEDYIRKSAVKFLGEMLLLLLVLGACLFAASYLQFMLIVRPITRLSRSMEAVANRESTHLQGEFPKEIQPLAIGVNALLSSQESALRGARERSADIAHSLKTPLTAIRNNAARLIENGEEAIGREIGSLADAMTSHVERELARSRLAPSAALRHSDADLQVTLNNIVRILRKVPVAENLNWQLDVAGAPGIGMDPHDLQELLGNLLENASKWASSCIVIHGEMFGSCYHLTIEDDGPGLETDKIESMMRRGQRHDEHVAGTGVGLGIVQDIVDLYSIKLTIQNRQTHGLIINLVLPAITVDCHTTV